jgi:exodeoxyribonuclease VII large subunit
MAADQRASTPSNAAELLVPDKMDILKQLVSLRNEAGRLLTVVVKTYQKELETAKDELAVRVTQQIKQQKDWLAQSRLVLEIVNPLQALKRGYAVVRKNGEVVRSVVGIKHGERLDVMLSDGTLKTEVQ